VSAGTQGTYSILIQVKGAVEAGNQIKSLSDSLTQVDSRVKQSSTTLNDLSQWSHTETRTVKDKTINRRSNN
jgi:hypothetical protein